MFQSIHLVNVIVKVACHVQKVIDGIKSSIVVAVTVFCDVRKCLILLLMLFLGVDGKQVG